MSRDIHFPPMTTFTSFGNSNAGGNTNNSELAKTKAQLAEAVSLLHHIEHMRMHAMQALGEAADIHSSRYNHEDCVEIDDAYGEQLIEAIKCNRYSFSPDDCKKNMCAHCKSGSDLDHCELAKFLKEVEQ